MTKSTRVYLCLLGLLSFLTWRTDSSSRHACFNNVLDIQCESSEIIVFNSARYGRNNTEIAARCTTPFQRNCDIDAHFTLNRLCAGQPKCALVVNTQLFGDPCGYEEFLTVSYTCVPVSSMHRSCQSPGSPPFFDHGYIASPNYPSKYYSDAECVWHLAVQPRQTIKVTIFDFELDVKREGKCYDYLEIETRGQSAFQDCGALGKQSITVDSNTALIRFKTGQSSLTQRGFFIYFNAVGPGCPDLTIPMNGTVVYRMFNGELTANVTCLPGFVFAGSDHSTMMLRCKGSEWNLPVSTCVEFVPTTTQGPSTRLQTATSLGTTSLIPTGSNILTSEANDLVKSGSIIGIALGVVSALLLIALLLILSLYLHRRRKKAERKLDQMRVVFNNLQENAMNDETIQQVMDASLNLNTPSNMRKGKKGKKNKNYKEDDLQGRNLLSPPCYADDDDYDSPKDIMSETYMKYPMIIDDTYKSFCSRQASRSGKHSLCRSRDSYLDGADSPYEWDEYDITRTRQSRPRPSRTRSGVWDNKSVAIAMTPRVPQQGGRLLLTEKKAFTQSAPDILELMAQSSSLPDLGQQRCQSPRHVPHYTQYMVGPDLQQQHPLSPGTCPVHPNGQVTTPDAGEVIYFSPHADQTSTRMPRSSALGSAVYGHRTLPPKNRSNSRGRIPRC